MIEYFRLNIYSKILNQPAPTFMSGLILSDKKHRDKLFDILFKY